MKVFFKQDKIEELFSKINFQISNNGLKKFVKQFQALNAELENKVWSGGRGRPYDVLSLKLHLDMKPLGLYQILEYIDVDKTQELKDVIPFETIDLFEYFKTNSKYFNQVLYEKIELFRLYFLYLKQAKINPYKNIDLVVDGFGEFLLEFINSNTILISYLKLLLEEYLNYSAQNKKETNNNDFFSFINNVVNNDNLKEQLQKIKVNIKNNALYNGLLNQAQKFSKSINIGDFSYGNDMLIKLAEINCKEITNKIKNKDIKKELTNLNSIFSASIETIKKSLFIYVARLDAIIQSWDVDQNDTKLAKEIKSILVSLMEDIDSRVDTVSSNENENQLNSDAKLNIDNQNQLPQEYNHYYENAWVVCLKDYETGGKNEKLVKYKLYQISNLKYNNRTNKATCNISGSKYRWSLSRFRVVDTTALVPEKSKYDVILKEIKKTLNNIKEL